MVCFELLSAQSNDYRSFSFSQAQFSPIYLNMLASGQFSGNVVSGSSFTVIITDMPTAILSYAHPGAHRSWEGDHSYAERPRL